MRAKQPFFGGRAFPFGVRHVHYLLSFPKKYLQEFIHYGTVAADFHFFLPVFLGLAFADCTIDQPTEFAGIILIGRTFFASLWGALFYDPAGFGLGQVALSPFP